MKIFVILIVYISFLSVKADIIVGPEVANTFARYIDKQGNTSRVLVTSASEKIVRGFKLDCLEEENYFELIRRYGKSINEAAQKCGEASIERNKLITPNDFKSRHIAAGGNYSEHADETNLDEVFLFPKFSKVTKPISSVGTDENILLDYEVEICISFDRDIKSIQDYQDSSKGIFLCGDYSDRQKLLKLINVNNVEGGRGFTDAKSGNDRMPIGEFFVIPYDFEAFFKTITFSLKLNGEVKQSSSTKKLILNTKKLIGKAINGYREGEWEYRGERIDLLEEPIVKKGQVLLTGTPEGVIYNKPTTSFKVISSIQWILTLSFLKENPVQYLLEKYIRKAHKKKIFLQPGDKVLMQAKFLGRSIQIIQKN